MSKPNLYGSFVQALFFSGTVGIPKYFLKHYSELKISPMEALLIIHLISEMENDPFPSTQLLAQRLNVERDEVEELIDNLVSRQLLSIEKQWNPQSGEYYSRYSFTGLVDELSEHWAIEQLKVYEAEQAHVHAQQKALRVEGKSHSSLENIIRTFEQELGRPITPIECEVIDTWFASNFSEELILEAFKRGVMAGIRNFRYIDSILREWEKKGLRTIHEVQADDAYFQARQEKARGKRTANQGVRKIPSDKYEDFYL
ncbi:MAG: DnaD domain protein [Desulfitobacterium sp.]|nr:DnaD domain protein [Desulfitobacterium sp.]